MHSLVRRSRLPLLRGRSLRKWLTSQKLLPCPVWNAGSGLCPGNALTGISEERAVICSLVGVSFSEAEEMDGLEQSQHRLWLYFHQHVWHQISISRRSFLFQLDGHRRPTMLDGCTLQLQYLWLHAGKQDQQVDVFAWCPEDTKEHCHFLFCLNKYDWTKFFHADSVSELFTPCVNVGMLYRGKSLRTGVLVVGFHPFVVDAVWVFLWNPPTLCTCSQPGRRESTCFFLQHAFVFLFIRQELWHHQSRKCGPEGSSDSDGWNLHLSS